MLAGILPFASRAVYTDEPQYLHIAKSALEHDWRFPQDTGWVFFGKRYANLAAQTHLPVVEYYLALLFKVIGHFDEVRFRLLFAAFPLMAVLSFYRLAKHFTGNPFLVSCLFAVSPAFFVLSPTLLMDIPMLAFFLTGLSLYLEGLKDSSRLWPCSICFILAAGTGYTVLVPIGCLLLWAIWTRRPAGNWIPIAAAPAAILVWLLILRLHFGQSPTTELIGYYTSHFSLSRTVAPVLSFIGGISLFPWMHLALVEKRSRRILAALSVLAAVVLSFLANSSSLPHRLWYVFLASSGIGLLALFVTKAATVSQTRPNGYGFLILWLPATLLFFLLFAEMISARYMLLCLPPLFLVVFDQVRRSTAGCFLVASMALSVALAVADYRLVNSYPRWVDQNILPIQQQDFRAWNAAESGLRFYLEKRGIPTLENTDLRPRGGDLVIRQESFNYGLSKDLEPVLVNVRGMNLLDAFPIRTFSRDARAGFHDSHFGIVPFALSRAPLDRLEIFEVSPFVTELPQKVPEDFSSVPVWFPGGVLLKQVEPEMQFHLRIPRNARVEYTLVGEGSVVVGDDTIILKKTGAGPVVWKNFRIVPKAWPE